MRKLFLLLVVFFICKLGFSQTPYPITQNIGSGSTLVRVPTPGGFQASLIMRSFASTAAADATPIAAYPGAIIYVSTSDKIYLRNSTATSWIEIGSGGGGVSGAENGLSLSGTDVIMGGTLNQGTTVAKANFDMSFTGSGGFLVRTEEDDITLDADEAAGDINLNAGNTQGFSIGGTAISTITSTGVGIGITSPASLLNVQRNAIGVTQSDAYGVLLSNSTAAALGAQQMSPRLVFRGNGWKTTAGGASQDTRWAIDILPIQAAVTPQANLQFGYSVNGGAYTTQMQLSSSGALRLFGTGGSSFGSVNSVALGSSNGVVFFGAIPTSATGTSLANTSVGSAALQAITDGQYNVAIGNSAMASNTTGGTNTGVGYQSLAANTNGYSNTALGTNSMLVLNGGFQNTSIGAGSMENATTAQENVAVGYDAGLNATSAIRNVWVGWNAKTGTSGYENVAIGYLAGAALTTGNRENTAIGFQSMYHASQKVDAVNTIAIGHNSYTEADNSVVIGNSSMTQFDFWGALRPGGSAGTSGYVLTSAGAGTTPTWTNPTSLVTNPALSSITAATTSNSIGNLNNTQTWTWNTLSGQGFVVGASSTSAAGDAQTLFSALLQGANATSTQTTYAAKFSNTHTGTSSTNIGIQAIAADGTNNYAIIVPPSSGNVGIGTSTPTSLAHINGVLQMGTAGSTLGQLLMSGNTSGTVTITTAAAAGTYSLTLPTNDGNSGEFLQTDGSGVLSWAAGGSGITIGTTTVTSGTNTRILYNNSGVVGEYVVSGSGNVAMTTSPVFTTPNLGTPSAVTLTNGTGLPDGGLALTDVTTNNSSTSNHGFLKKLDNNAYNFMNGAGNWAMPFTDVLRTYQLLGSPIKAEPMGFTIQQYNQNTSLGDGTVRYEVVYLPQDATITGVKWYQITAGNYTGDNYNGVGLYSYSGGTLTLVASSTNDATIWAASANTLASKAFSSTYAASAGIYVVAALYNQSAQTTAPAVAAISIPNSNMSSLDFTNSMKLHATQGGQSALPSPTVASTSLSANNATAYFALY